MKKVAKFLCLAFLFMFVLPFAFFFSAESISKNKAERVCGEIKLGMSSLELSKLAEEKGARTRANEKNNTITVVVDFPISGAYLCRMQMNSGSVVNIGKMERMPGG